MTQSHKNDKYTIKVWGDYFQKYHWMVDNKRAGCELKIGVVEISNITRLFRQSLKITDMN